MRHIKGTNYLHYVQEEISTTFVEYPQFPAWSLRVRFFVRLATLRHFAAIVYFNIRGGSPTPFTSQ
jgi:hypothetical protein